MCELAVQQDSDCICGQEELVNARPSCDKCELLVFPDGEYFHKRTCPQNLNPVDSRDAAKTAAERAAKDEGYITAGGGK